MEKKRTFYGKVAIVGPTGTGKSYITKTVDKNSTGYINSELQPLPYKAEQFKFTGTPKSWAGFIKNLTDYGSNPEIKTIIIDSQTMAFNQLNSEMQTTYTGWDIAKNYNREVTKYLKLLREIEKDVLVFSHDELVKVDDGTKQRRMKVHNKEFEGKIEEYFTIVLYTGTRLANSKPSYFLRTFWEDSSAKTPFGLFPDKNGENILEIPNDGQYIFSALENYYTI